MRTRVWSASRALGRLGAVGTAGGVGVVAVLMVLSPLAAGAHTYKAPYTGMVTSPYSYQAQSACGSTSISSPFNWSSTTGQASFAGKVTSKPCSSVVGSVGGDSYAYTSNEAQLALPLKMTNGPHNVTVNWKLNPVITQTVTNGTCSGSLSTPTYWYCDLYQYREVYVYAELYDLTNGSYVPMTCCNYYWENYNYSSNETEFYNFSGTPSWYNYSYGYSYISPGTGSLYDNTTWSLIRSHAYYLIMYVEVSMEAETYSYGATFSGAFVSMSVNMLGGHAALLSSVVVS